jgi:RNA polymerase sigma-70 factor (ECF subfamily)
MSRYWYLGGSRLKVAEVGRPRSNEEWLADLTDERTQGDALADLREYLLRAVVSYLYGHREDLANVDPRELEHLAEDSCQDALLQIMNKLDTFRGESKFTTWAYRFVINIAAGELRLHRWRTLSMESLVSDQEIPLFTFVSDQKAPDPETVAARHQVLDLLYQIINEDLTELQRFALVSVHFQGVPVAVVAKQLNSTPNNVYKLIHDARKKLKKGLQQSHYSEADVLAIFGEL